MVLAVAVSLSTACPRSRGARPTELSRADALGQVTTCAFDGVAAGADEREVEAAIRRAVRGNRMSFAERTGRCITVLDGSSDGLLRELNDAWVSLLQRVQSREPDDLALEREIRHVGNAWRAARR